MEIGDLKNSWFKKEIKLSPDKCKDSVVINLEEDNIFKNCRFSSDKFFWTDEFNMPDSANYITKNDTLIFVGKEFDWWNSVAIQIFKIKEDIMNLLIISKEDNKVYWCMTLKRVKSSSR